MPAFVPPDFDIPRRLETPDFILRPLTIHDLLKDYAAVMTSVERLQGVFGPGSDWPRPDMTLEEDLADLGSWAAPTSIPRSGPTSTPRPIAGSAPRPPIWMRRSSPPSGTGC